MTPIFEKAAPRYDWINRIIGGPGTPFSRRLALQHLRGSLMANPISFQGDILPLFTERDIRAMSKAFNLASYDDVKAHAAIIFDRIRGIGGAVMPPPPPRGEGPWSNERIDLFGRWMADGYQP
jgi:hypothetical protein